MARRRNRFAVMVTIAGLCTGLGAWASAAPGPDDPPRLAQVPQGNVAKKKTKAGKKGTARPAMPAEGETNPSADTSGGLKFSRDIAPILVANCAGCHKAGHRSGFDQTTFDGLMKGGKGGKEIVPGNPDESHLVLRIKGEETPKMPPGNARLSPAAIAKIEEWVRDGAQLDPGRSSSEPMAKYAPSPEDLRRAELAKLSPEDRDKKTEAAARERFKKADPNAKPELTASPHFLLFAHMPKERASALLKGMEAQYAKLNRLMAGGGGRGMNTVEKVGLYVFKDLKGFTEFTRSIENQDVEAGEQARAKLGVESPYLTALDPLSGGADASTSSKKAGKSKKGDDSVGGPERSLAGLLTEQLTVGAIAGTGKPPRWLTGGVGALMASGVEPRSPYFRKLRAEASEQYREGWQSKANEALGDQGKPETVRAVGFAVVEWLASTNPNALGPFIQGMSAGGNKLDDALRTCLDGTREQFLQATGEWIDGQYAGRR